MSINDPRIPRNIIYFNLYGEKNSCSIHGQFMIIHVKDPNATRMVFFREAGFFRDNSINLM